MSNALEAAVDSVLGGLDWLKQVIIGEFDENRDMSAVIADMLLSFVPGVVIVTSARDLTAVIVRLAKHPEKRDNVEEWMLLIACVVPLVLPILAAAAGAAAAGVGAIIGGIGGSEAGAALRAVCLLLIKKGAYALVEIVGFLRRFIKGDILKVMRDIKFAQYGPAMVKYIGDYLSRVINIIRKVRAKLKWMGWIGGVFDKLNDLERAFYGVQTSAIKAIPKALAELDIRLQHVLAQALPHEPRLAHAGIPAPDPKPVRPEPNRVSTMQGNPLGRPDGTQTPGSTPRTRREQNLHPEDPREPKLKTMKEKKVPCFKSDNLPAGKAAEMERQLAGQQTGLNSMTVQEYLDGRDKFKSFGRGSGKPAVDARAAYEDKLVDDLAKRYRDGGMSPAQAERQAIADASDRMRTLAALHSPDMVAGGTNVIADMGDRKVNSSIGSQWRGRVGDIDTTASAVPAGERATTKMNVKLERCK